MIDQRVFRNILIVIIFAAILVLTFMILRPIFVAILFGLLLAYIFSPLYKWAYKKTKKRNISAASISIIALIVIFLPLWFSASELVKQIFNVYSTLQSADLTSVFENIFPFLFSNTDIAYNFNLALNSFINNTANILMEKITEFIVDIPSIMLQLFVVLFVFYYGLRDADLLKQYIKDIFPFNQETTNKFFIKSSDVTFSIVYGNIIVGLIQGLAAGIGLFIAGVPNALLLTIVAIILSIIPLIGSWLIWVPASIFLAINGNPGSALFLAIYGFFFVSIIDNIVRPYLVSKKTKMPNSIALIGMIGGLLVFGILGLLIGPLVLAYLLLILELYRNKQFGTLFAIESPDAESLLK